MAFSSPEFYDGELEAARRRSRGHLLRDLPGVRPDAADRDAGAVHRHGRRGLRRGAGAGRREPAATRRRPSWSCRKVRALLDAGRAGRGHRGDRALRGAGAAAARAAAGARAGDRQRGRLPGPREGGGGPVAGAVQPRGRDRLPGRRAADERGPDAGPAQAAGRRRQRDAGGHPFYRDLFTYFEAIGAYHTVWEEMGS